MLRMRLKPLLAIVWILLLCIMSAGCFGEGEKGHPPSVVVYYEKSTGDIKSLVLLDSYEGVDSFERHCPPGQGCEPLENYPDEMVWGIINDDRQYIYDLSLKKIRMRTPEELLDYFKQYETLPDNRIRVTISWRDYEIRLESSSTVLGVRFDSTKKLISIDLSGADGTSGATDIWVPKDLITSPSEIKIYLDGKPVDFSLSEQEDEYFIHVEYTHSNHVLLASLGPGGPPARSRPLHLALVALAILITIGIICWFRLRRRPR